MGIRGFRSWFESQFPDSMIAFNKSDGEGGETITTANTASTTAESFDHVLIDMNQLLHIVLRKSRSDGHGLILLMKELDSILAHVATPQQSLVLAMDGPPAAAKLATQRKRRFQTVTRSHLKLQKLDQLLAQQQQLDNNNNKVSKKKRRQIQQWTRKKRKAVAELRTLCISPSTEFMARAEQAILYWAWQRLSSRHGVLGSSNNKNNIKLFISGSTVPGEGEVKLLEWIYHHRQRRGASIAILGGDSDLVLEALVVPLQCSHNVFVLLPDGSRRYLAVNLWETTRRLDRLLMLPPPPSSATAPAIPAVTPTVSSTSIRDMIRVRTDLVLLLMLNGNDYLPKVRGSSGFNRLFHTYLKLQREWRQTHHQQQRHSDSCCLVDPDTLEFQLDFCLEYFGRLARAAPHNLWRGARNKNNNNHDSITPLQQLHNLVEMSFLPQPLEFRVIYDNDEQQRILNEEEDEVDGDDDDDDENEEDLDEIFRKVLDDNDDGEAVDDEEDTDENRVLVRLFLGEPGTEDFYSYDLWHPRGVSLKQARQKLAAMALADLAEDDEQDSDGSENEEEEDGDGLSITSAGYDWEIRHAVEGKVDTYLYGLLWNLQTYQDGVCADYGYNYGKRLAPTARDIVEFFQAAKRDNRKVGPRELRSTSFTPPVSAAVSCLAALPSPVKHLVPEPYRSIPDAKVEAYYGECMDPEDNVFDMKRFEQLCEDEIRSKQAAVNGTEDAASSVKDETSSPNDEGRRILMGDHYWSVISKVPKPLPRPFDPPEPFSDRLSKLRPNSRIRVSRLIARATPRPRSAWGDKDSSLDIHNSDPGPFLNKLKTVDKVDYQLAYQKTKKRRGLRKGQVKITVQVKEPSSATVNGATDATTAKLDETNLQLVDVESRKKAFNIEPPPVSPASNKDGDTAMAILKQLSDLKMIGTIEWETIAPSKSEYASFDPKNHELIRLTVGKGVNCKTSVLHENLVYEQDRYTNGESRRIVQHHLASFALCDITGPAIRWSDVSYRELTEFLADTKVEG